MPTNITTITALELSNDFATLDVNQASHANIQNDSSLESLVNSQIRYQRGTPENPTGIWIVDNQRATAGQILLAQMYSGWLSANSSAQTLLTSMNVNTILSNNASNFAKALRTEIDGASADNSWTYADVTAIAGNHLNNSGMTASQFMTAMFPDEGTSATYTSTELLSLIDKVNQYSNARLTDNNVLQNKYEVTTSIINSTIDAMSNLLKAWQTMLTTLGRNV